MIDPSKKRTTLRGDDRAAALVKARDLYGAPGATVRTVARDLGLSYGTANALLTEAGVLRSKSGKPRDTAAPVKPEA